MRDIHGVLHYTLSFSNSVYKGLQWALHNGTLVAAGIYNGTPRKHSEFYNQWIDESWIGSCPNINSITDVQSEFVSFSLFISDMV